MCTERVFQVKVNRSFAIRTLCALYSSRCRRRKLNTTSIIHLGQKSQVRHLFLGPRFGSNFKEKMCHIFMPKPCCWYMLSVETIDYPARATSLEKAKFSWLRRCAGNAHLNLVSLCVKTCPRPSPPLLSYFRMPPFCR